LNGTYDVGVDYQLGSRISIGAIAQYLTENYNTIPGLQVIDLTHSTEKEVNGHVDFKLNRRFSFTLTAGDLQRNANFPGLNYNSVTVGMGVKATF
jgi:hypothetical protein